MIHSRPSDDDDDDGDGDEYDDYNCSEWADFNDQLGNIDWEYGNCAHKSN